MDVIQKQPKDQHNLQNQPQLRQLQLQKEILNEWDNSQQQSQQHHQQQHQQQQNQQQKQIAGTTIKPPEKQFSNLQEKQPYADKWICQR